MTHAQQAADKLLFNVFSRILNHLVSITCCPDKCRTKPRGATCLSWIPLCDFRGILGANSLSNGVCAPPITNCAVSVDLCDLHRTTDIGLIIKYTKDNYIAMTGEMDMYSQCLEVIRNATAETDGGGGGDQQSLDLEQLVLCLAKAGQKQHDDFTSGLDTFFLIFAASLVFFMQAGFAMLCAGSVQKKNVQNTMLKNLLDACGAALGFYSVGYAFAYGGSEPGGQTSFIGNTNFFLMGVDDYVFWLFQFAFAATSATIVAGTLAERCQMAAYLCYSVMLSGFVYPVIVHAVWSYNGFLSPRNVNPLFGVGMIDFAGSGVVHMTGGITAFIAAKILGARKGRFYDERGTKLTKPKSFPGHSIALQVLGSFILWFGWYGFNVGSTRTISSELDGKIAALAGVNTTLAAAAGGVASLVINLFLVERKTGEPYFSLNYAMNGCLGGLVCITAGCALIEPWAAIIAGFIAGLLYLWFSNVLVRLCIDGAVDAIPVHMINGFWGLIVTGLFATPEHMQNAYGNSEHVG